MRHSRLCHRGGGRSRCRGERSGCCSGGGACLLAGHLLGLDRRPAHAIHVLPSAAYAIFREWVGPILWKARERKRPEGGGNKGGHVSAGKLAGMAETTATITTLARGTRVRRTCRGFAGHIILAPCILEFGDEILAHIGSFLPAKYLGRLACVAPRFTVVDTARPEEQPPPAEERCSPVEEAARVALARLPQAEQDKVPRRKGESWLKTLAESESLRGPLLFTSAGYSVELPSDFSQQRTFPADGSACANNLQYEGEMHIGTSVLAQCGERMRAGTHRCYFLMPSGAGASIRVGIVPAAHKLHDENGDESNEPFEGGCVWAADGTRSIWRAENGEPGKFHSWRSRALAFNNRSWYYDYEEEGLDEYPVLDLIGMELDMDTGFLCAFKNGKRCVRKGNSRGTLCRLNEDQLKGEWNWAVELGCGGDLIIISRDPLRNEDIHSYI
eukprot:COSAG01_NODE_9534_length_2416_cov_25.170479_2_plen_443_part_00